MNGWGVGWRRAALVGLGASTVLAAVMSLSGCASAGASGAEVEKDTISSSGETDVRRRARIRLELAANYLQRGQASVALEETRQALATDPTFTDAYHLRGLIYMQMNDLNLAEENLLKAQGMRPSDPDIMHNLGWLACQKQQYAQAEHMFDKALAVPTYMDRSKTMMSKGVCLVRSGKPEEAEPILQKAYEFDAANPIIGYELAQLKYNKGDARRAQFYIRRVNNGSFASAESLWLGIKIERSLGDQASVRQLAGQLHKRFPDSKQSLAYERGAFNE